MKHLVIGAPWNVIAVLALAGVLVMAAVPPAPEAGARVGVSIGVGPFWWGPPYWPYYPPPRYYYPVSLLGPVLVSLLAARRVRPARVRPATTGSAGASRRAVLVLLRERARVLSDRRAVPGSVDQGTAAT